MSKIKSNNPKKSVNRSNNLRSSSTNPLIGSRDSSNIKNNRTNQLRRVSIGNKEAATADNSRLDFNETKYIVNK